MDLAVDGTGTYLYALDKGTGGRPNKIRRVTIATGEVDTLVSGDSWLARGPTHIRLDSLGQIWVAVGPLGTCCQSIVRYPAGGGAGTEMLTGVGGGPFNGGGAFAFNPAGTMLYYESHLSDQYDSQHRGALYEIPIAALPATAPSGTPLAYPPGNTRSALLDARFGPDGKLYVVWDNVEHSLDGYADVLYRYNGPVGPLGPGRLTRIDRFRSHPRMVIAPTGTLYSLCQRYTSSAGEDNLCFGTSAIERRVGFGFGFGTVVAGSSTSGFQDGFPGQMATLSAGGGASHGGLAMSTDGSKIWIADSGNRRIRTLTLPVDPVSLAGSEADSEFWGPNPSLDWQCPCRATTNKPIDTWTGNEHFALPGLDAGGRGPGLHFELAYNSRGADAAGMAGHGWASTYEMSMRLESDGTRVIHQETGSTVRFFPTVAGGWWVPARHTAALSLNRPGFVGGSRPWKRGWSHAYTGTVGEADVEAVLA